MSSKKLEDINGGILTYGYAFEVIIRDVSTLYPLIWRGSWGDRDLTMGLPNSTDLSHLQRLDNSERF